MKQLFLIFILTGTVAPTVYAQQTEESRTNYDRRDLPSSGLFLEPMVQFSQIDSEIKTSQLPLISDDTSGKSEGAGLGLRLGGHASDIIFLAVDGRYSKLQLKDSSYGDADGASFNYGPTLGLQTPFFGIRVWGTYVMGGEYDPAAGSSDVDAKFLDARGTRVGGGIRFAALSVNLEYEDLKYNNTDIQSVGNVNLDTSSEVDMESKGYLLSVSFPLSL